MLSPTTSHTPRPAAGNRRRFCIRAALLLGIAAGACAVPPPDDTAARTAVARAAALVRPHHPEALADLDRLVTRAEAASRTAAAHPRSNEARWLAERAWLEAAAEAATQTRRLRAELARERVRWLSIEPETAIRVAEADRLLRGPGMGATEAAAVSRARAQLGLAQRLAAAGEYTQAVAAAERALEAATVPGLTWRAQHERFADPAALARWRAQRQEAVARSRRERAPLIVVDKLARKLHLYVAGRLERSFAAELGVNGLQRKRHAGDRATPEGLYRVERKKAGAATRYYLALLLDYPNADDLRRFRAARSAGEVPPGVSPGNLIEIHGHGGSGRDWTDGCVALTDDDMDALYRRVAVGTPVLIVGAL